MIKARARPIPGVMNKAEMAYAAKLKIEQALGVVASFKFERHRLVIGVKRCTYTPDFEVVTSKGHIEFHEVKGFWRDDARVKIKAAAMQFPEYTFKAVTKRAKKRGGGWEVEEF